MNDAILEIIASPEVPDDYILDSIYDIEEVLEYLATLNGKIDHLKKLKQHRIEAIDSKLGNFNNRVARLRKLILDTMIKMSPDQKTIDFTPIGKITRRKSKKTWEVLDEESLLAFLENKGVKEEVIVTKETVNKKKLTDILDKLAKTSDLIPGAVLNAGEESVSITYEKNYKAVEKEEDETEEPIKEMPSSVSADDLEDLVI